MGVKLAVLNLVIVVILLVLWIIRQRKLESWRRAGIPCPRAWPIFGNYAPFILQQKTSGMVAQDICRKYPDAPIIGTFYGTEPALLIQDPELIKTVLAKDFVFFNGREVSSYAYREAITSGLPFTYGDQWKVIKHSSTPFFTSAKIKSMFKHVRKCNYMLEDLLEHLTKTCENAELGTKDVMTRYTMDNICSIGFGIDTDTLAIDYDPKNPYIRIGNLIFENSYVRGLAILTRQIWPAIFYGVGLKVFPDIITKFFENMLMKVFEDRNYEPSQRNDFVDMVLGLKKMKTIKCENMMKDGTASIEVDDKFLVVQCMIIFGAGFDTTATILNFTLYELAKCPDAQDMALKEIDAWLKENNNKLDYSCVTDLPYLDACVNETLRFYPAQPLLAREVMMDHELAGVTVPKGMRIHIPVYHLHHHEEFYPEPLKFKPERFLGKNRQNIKPFTYMPFGEGQRICIGIRVAKMTILSGLVTVLKRYRVELASGTAKKPTLDPRTLTTQAKEDLILRFIPRANLDQVIYDRS